MLYSASVSHFSGYTQKEAQGDDKRRGHREIKWKKTLKISLFTLDFIRIKLIHLCVLAPFPLFTQQDVPTSD